MGLFSNNQKESNINFDALDLKFPLSYDIKQETEFYINNSSINHTTTEIELNINAFKKLQNGYRTLIELGTHKIIDCQSQYKKLIEFISKFNIPVSELDIELNENGIPSKILNQKNVFEKWIKLRDEEMVSLKNDETMRPILLGGDKDFSNTSEMLNKSTMYIFFFPAVYGMRDLSNVRNIKLASQLYQGEKIEFSIRESLISISNINTCFLHEANGIYDYDKMRSMYKKGYKQLFSDTKFDYNCSYKATYEYNLKNGILERCGAAISEDSMHKRLIYKQVFNIQRNKQ